MSDQSTYPPATRTLPQSNALAEAEPTSIQDLFNRNPEGLSDRSIDAIIMEMRTLRVRLESTGTIGPRNGPRAPRQTMKAKLAAIDIGGLLDDDDE